MTNGKVLFAGADGRRRHARRMRDLLHSFLSATGGRHEQTCRSIATLCVVREELDAKLARGDAIDTAELVSVVGAISRLMVRAGLTAADEPEAPDATDQVIAALRAQTEAALMPTVGHILKELDRRRFVNGMAALAEIADTDRDLVVRALTRAPRSAKVDVSISSTR